MTEATALYEIAQAMHDDAFLQRLAAFMQSYRGAANAVKGKVLASEFGFKNDRAIRAAFAELAERGIVIVSSVHKPYGFFIAEAPEEVEKCERTFGSRAAQLLKHLRALRRAKQIKFGGQLSLSLIDEMIAELDRS